MDDPALALDPAWQPARDGIERTGSALATDAYETQMAAGYAALANKEFSAARRSFKAALAARPGDRAAREGLTQLDTENNTTLVGQRASEADILEFQETVRAELAQQQGAGTPDPGE